MKMKIRPLFFIFIHIITSSCHQFPSQRLSPSKINSKALSHQKEFENSCPLVSQYQDPKQDHFRLQLVSNSIYLINSIFSHSTLVGLISGSLHAITGPDHIAALIPVSIGKSGWVGARLGAIWGIGHGISSLTLGISVFLLKDQISSRITSLKHISSFAECIVGLSLLGIGIIGLKESLEPDFQSQQILSSAKQIFFNGFIHGFSWDGAPSLIPALTQSSIQSSLSFLLFYSVGTFLAMSLSAGVVGEASLRIGSFKNDPLLPKKLSLFSSLVAGGVGLVWFARALLILKK